MSYTLIKGYFHIHYPATPLNGPEPDGDTLKFQPDDRALIIALPKPNQPASFNRDGITSIRFEGIDALARSGSRRTRRRAPAESAATVGLPIQGVQYI